MTKFRTRLPPFAALVAFEAAARLNSFTAAANELGVSQPAVTRQIRDFENMIGAPLFHRLHRSVELTERGRELAVTLSSNLLEIAEAVDRLRIAPGEVALKVTAYVSFASLWLVPRMTEFCAAHPHVSIDTISQDRGMELMMGSADLAIRYGAGHWTDGEVHYLLHEQLFPVCSPEYLAKHGGHIALNDLWQHKIIEDRSNGEWPGWPEFMRHHGIRGERLKVAHQYTYYTDALMAALAGHGILMGWRSLIGPHIASGRLIRLTPHTMASLEGHYIVVRHEKKNLPIMRSLVGWLQEEGRRSMDCVAIDSV